jgi:hypothetical protein
MPVREMRRPTFIAVLTELRCGQLLRIPGNERAFHGSAFRTIDRA